jgi:hypothetical protein
MYESFFFTLSVLLLLFPIFQIFMNDRKTLKENKIVYRFLVIYLICLCLFYGFEIGIGVYFHFMEGIVVPLFILLMLSLAVMVLIDLSEDEWGKKIRKQNWQLLMGFFFVVIGLVIFNLLSPSEPSSQSITPSTPIGYILIFLLLILFIVPFTLLFYHFRVFQKKGILQETSKRELKDVNKFFAIITVVSLIVSIMGIIYIYDLPSFSGQLDFGEAGESISKLFGTVLNDDLFQFTAAVIVISGVARAIPNRYANMGGAMAMVIMPLILWMEYLFNPTPEVLLEFFLGWDIIAKSFYILVSTLGIVMLLAGANIVIGLVRGSL